MAAWWGGRKRERRGRNSEEVWGEQRRRETLKHWGDGRTGDRKGGRWSGVMQFKLQTKRSWCTNQALLHTPSHPPLTAGVIDIQAETDQELWVHVGKVMWRSVLVRVRGCPYFYLHGNGSALCICVCWLRGLGRNCLLTKALKAGGRFLLLPVR